MHGNYGSTAAAVIDLHIAVPCCTTAVLVGYDPFVQLLARQGVQQ
jgi:hypothetical protein